MKVPYRHLIFLNAIILAFVSVATCDAYDTNRALLQNSARGADLSSVIHYQDRNELEEELVQILSDMGYNSLAMIMLSTPDISLIGRRGSATLFAPTDEAFHNSAHTFSPGRLNQHIVNGIFTSRSLASLPDGTKLDTVVAGYSLVVTTRDELSIADSKQVFVNGVAVAHPDLFNDGLLAIHGVDSFLDSDITSLDARPPFADLNETTPADVSAYVAAPAMPPFITQQYILRGSMYSLRNRGYSVLALAMRLKSAELLGLHSLTIFAVSDDTVFSGGQEFVNRVKYHIVPNKRLLFADLLIRLPVGATMETLVQGRSLVLTNKKPVSINNVPLKTPDVFINRCIAVHEIRSPLPYHAASIGRADQTINGSFV